jgi:hypothetical protein
VRDVTAVSQFNETAFLARKFVSHLVTHVASLPEFRQ